MDHLALVKCVKRTNSFGKSVFSKITSEFLQDLLLYGINLSRGTFSSRIERRVEPITMAENIKYRIDKIESDMRYLRYLQTSKKEDACRQSCRPEKRPRLDNMAYAKLPPVKQKPLTNYIHVSRPAFAPRDAWGHVSTTPPDLDAQCDARCKASCITDRRLPPPFVEPPFIQACRPLDGVPCVKACRAPCMENSRRPAAIYKDLTLPSKKVPLVDHCTPRRAQPFEDVCLPECKSLCSEAARRGVPVVEDGPCLPTCTMGHNDKVKGRSPSKGRHLKGHSPNRKLSESELLATDKKMRELENRLRESNDKLREVEAQRDASDEKLRTLEEQLREAEKEAARSEEQLRTLERSISDLETKLSAAERDNEKLRTNLETSRAASRRNSEAQAMALDLATKIADKYKSASAEKVEALNEIDNLKAEGEALLQRLKAAEQKAASLELEAQKPHVDCQDQLDNQAAEIARLKQALKDSESRTTASNSTEIEDLKREAENSKRRAAEAEARAQEAGERAKRLEEESRVADERANEAENEARDARQRAKDAEQRASDLEAASDDPGRNRVVERVKRKCKCRSRSRKTKEVVEVPVQVKEIDYRTLRRHKCCLCCCKRNDIPRPREYPLAYRVDIR